MNKFKILMAMQLKEKLDLSFLHSKKQTMFKVIFSLLGFAVVTAVAYICYWLCLMFHLFSSSNIIPIGVVSILLGVIFVINTTSCTIGLSKSLFYAKDNQTIVTFPVSANQIYLSKMLVYYISEIKRAFSMLIPILLAYGIISKLALLFYIWMPIMVIIYTLIPVLIGGILCIPVCFVIGFFKKFPAIKFIVLVAVLSAIVFVVIKLINLIPEDIDLISSWIVVSKVLRNVLTWVAKNLYLFYALSILFCGKVQINEKILFTNYSWICLISIICIIVVLTLFNYLISKPLYLKIASKQFEFKRKINKKSRPNVVRSNFVASCTYEARKLFRDSSVVSNTILTIIVAPIVVLLLNRIYAAISTKLMGDYLTIAFNLLIIMLFTLAHNINVSSIYSRDADALAIGKTKPATPFISMFPRLMYNFITTTLILALSMISFVSNSTLTSLQGVLLFLGLLGIAFAHIVWSADIDFLKPQVQLFKTEGANTLNPNELKSTILAIAISAIFTGFAILLLLKVANYIWLKLCLLGIAFFVLRLVLFVKKIKVLYREM